jgi:hypothetical protein
MPFIPRFKSLGFSGISYKGLGSARLPGTYEPLLVGARIVPKKRVGAEYLEVSIFKSKIIYFQYGKEFWRERNKGSPRVTHAV